MTPVVELRGVGVRRRGYTGLAPLDLIAGPGECCASSGCLPARPRALTS